MAPPAPAVPFAARIIGWILLVTGAVGAAAAFVLTVEKIHLLRDPGYVPSCSINPILSCGSVMSTPQAEVLGFPNPVIGVLTFPVLATLGVVVLTGARLPRWLWVGAHLGAAAGVLFAHWLIFQSLYRIHALCPYCMVVWVVTITAFWYLTLHNLHHRHLPAPASWRPAVDAVVRNHSVVVTVWLLAVVAAIGVRFWDYWRTLLP
ncbi:vitamin K epoxide reductase family protein [Longispora urticae]